MTKCTIKINNEDYEDIDLVSGISYNTSKANTAENILSNNRNEFLTAGLILAIAFFIRLINIKRRKRKRARKAKLNKILNKKKR